MCLELNPFLAKKSRDMQGSLESLRSQFKPHKVSVLLLGESPPAALQPHRLADLIALEVQLLG